MKIYLKVIEIKITKKGITLSATLKIPLNESGK